MNNDLKTTVWVLGKPKVTAE